MARLNPWANERLTFIFVTGTSPRRANAAAAWFSAEDLSFDSKYSVICSFHKTAPFSSINAPDTDALPGTMADTGIIVLTLAACADESDDPLPAESEFPAPEISCLLANDAR